MSRAIAVVLLLISTACQEPAPCKGLEAVIASAASASSYEARAPLVAQGVAGACRTLPPEWSKVLAAETPAERMDSFSAAVPRAPSFWNDACVEGVRSIRLLGATSINARRGVVFRDCGFERLGFATENEYLATEGNSDFVLALTAPGLFHWLVERRVDRRQAVAVARLVAGIPAPLNVLGRDIRPDILPTEHRRKPRADLQVAVGKIGMDVGDREVCLEPYLAQFRDRPSCDPQLPSTVASALREAAAAARARGARESPVVALIVDREAPFDRVARTIDAMRRAGVRAELIAPAADGGWAGIPIGFESPAGALVVHFLADGRVRIAGEGNATLVASSGRYPDLKEVRTRLVAMRAARPDTTVLAVSADPEVEFEGPFDIVEKALLPEEKPLFEQVAVVRAPSASTAESASAAAPEP